MENKLLAPIVFLSGLCISGVAAFFSIIGLSTMFASIAMEVIAMGVVLEIGKLAAASWTFQNWYRAPWKLKGTLATFVVVLMTVTSLGIFGYLSKGYADVSAPLSGIQVELTTIDQQTEVERDRVTRASAALKQMDKSIDSLLEKDQTNQGLNARNRQARERADIRKEMKEANTALTDLQKQRAALQKNTNSIAQEVGPINFIAKAIFGDAQGNSVDRAVQIVIGLLVMVFDPLAVALLLAANYSFTNREKMVKEPILTQAWVTKVTSDDGADLTVVGARQELPPEPKYDVVIEEAPIERAFVDEVAGSADEASTPIGSVVYHDDGTHSIKGS